MIPTPSSPSTPSKFGAYPQAPSLPALDFAHASEVVTLNGVHHPAQQLTGIEEKDDNGNVEFFLAVQAVHHVDEDDEPTGQVSYAVTTATSGGYGNVNEYDSAADALSDYAESIDDVYGPHTERDRVWQHADAKAAKLEEEGRGDEVDFEKLEARAEFYIKRDTEYYAKVADEARATAAAATARL